jgi:hypothetical protein
MSADRTEIRYCSSSRVSQVGGICKYFCWLESDTNAMELWPTVAGLLIVSGNCFRFGGEQVDSHGQESPPAGTGLYRFCLP